MRERFQFYYDIRLEFQQPVRHHAFVLRCIPPSFPGTTHIHLTDPTK